MKENPEEDDEWNELWEGAFEDINRCEKREEQMDKDARQISSLRWYPKYHSPYDLEKEQECYDAWIYTDDLRGMVLERYDPVEI